MLTIARKRLQKDDEDGFTLIELMVVVLIIAILMAIAIPSFLSAQDRANDRSAQSNMRVGLTNARSIYTDTQAYPAQADLITALTAAEPNITFVGGALASGSAINSVAVAPTASVASGSLDTVTLQGKSKSGKCFQLQDVKGATSAITTIACP